MSPTLLVSNAEAGTHTMAAIEAARAVLERDIDVRHEQNVAPDDLDDLLREGSGPVVVAGGDGSLHAVVSALYRLQRLDRGPIGLIPLGTGNDFARGVGIPADPEAAAAVVVQGHRRPVDLIVDSEDQVVVNAVHVGVGAEAGVDAEAWKPYLGRLGYPVSAVIAGLRSTGVHLRVEADGQVLADGDRRVLQFGFANGPSIGGGTELAPDADVSDGRGDVIVSFAVPRKDRLLYAVHLRRGTHDERHDVRRVLARRVRVSSTETLRCNTDGDIGEPVREREWRVLPGAWELLAPVPR